MRPAEKRLAEFTTGTGRYARKRRPYGEPEEIVALKKQHHDALTTLRKSRDEWRQRAEAARAAPHVRRLAQLERVLADARRVAHALTELGKVSENAGVAFAARKISAVLEGLEGC
jgi:hypothetical protein